MGSAEILMHVLTYGLIDCDLDRPMLRISSE